MKWQVIKGVILKHISSIFCLCLHCDFVLKEQENQGTYHTQAIWTNYELVLTFNLIDKFVPST